MKTLQLFILIIFITTTMLENAFASNLNNIYATSQTPAITNYSSPMSTLSRNANELMKSGNKNYGMYGIANKRTNPVRFDNPYNHLNDKYTQTPTVKATKYDGQAVRFKTGKDGKLYGYDKNGNKIGIYKINTDGTTTLYDTNGNKMKTFK